MNKPIQELSLNGFKVTGRYILKRSSSSKVWKTVGYLNDTNFYFFSDNVYPYKLGENFFNQSTLVDVKDIALYKNYVKEQQEKENSEFKSTFKSYYKLSLIHI